MITERTASAQVSCGTQTATADGKPGNGSHVNRPPTANGPLSSASKPTGPAAVATTGHHRPATASTSMAPSLLEDTTAHRTRTTTPSGQQRTVVGQHNGRASPSSSSWLQEDATEPMVVAKSHSRTTTTVAPGYYDDSHRHTASSNRRRATATSMAEVEIALQQELNRERARTVAIRERRLALEQHRRTVGEELLRVRRINDVEETRLRVEAQIQQHHAVVVSDRRTAAAAANVVSPARRAHSPTKGGHQPLPAAHGAGAIPASRSALYAPATASIAAGRARPTIAMPRSSVGHPWPAPTSSPPQRPQPSPNRPQRATSKERPPPAAADVRRSSPSRLGTPRESPSQPSQVLASHSATTVDVRTPARTTDTVPSAAPSSTKVLVVVEPLTEPPSAGHPNEPAATTTQRASGRSSPRSTSAAEIQPLGTAAPAASAAVLPTPHVSPPAAAPTNRSRTNQGRDSVSRPRIASTSPPRPPRPAVVVPPLSPVPTMAATSPLGGGGGGGSPSRPDGNPSPLLLSSVTRKAPPIASLLSTNLLVAATSGSLAKYTAILSAIDPCVSSHRLLPSGTTALTGLWHDDAASRGATSHDSGTAAGGPRQPFGVPPRDSVLGRLSHGPQREGVALGAPLDASPSMSARGGSTQPPRSPLRGGTVAAGSSLPSTGLADLNEPIASCLRDESKARDHVTLNEAISRDALRVALRQRSAVALPRRQRLHELHLAQQRAAVIAAEATHRLNVSLAEGDDFSHVATELAPLSVAAMGLVERFRTAVRSEIIIDEWTTRHDSFEPIAQRLHMMAIANSHPHRPSDESHQQHQGLAISPRPHVGGGGGAKVGASRNGTTSQEEGGVMPHTPQSTSSAASPVRSAPATCEQHQQKALEPSPVHEGDSRARSAAATAAPPMMMPGAQLSMAPAVVTPPPSLEAQLEQDLEAYMRRGLTEHWSVVDPPRAALLPSSSQRLRRGRLGHWGGDGRDDEQLHKTNDVASRVAAPATIGSDGSGRGNDVTPISHRRRGSSSGGPRRGPTIRTQFDRAALAGSDVIDVESEEQLRAARFGAAGSGNADSFDGATHTGATIDPDAMAAPAASAVWHDESESKSASRLFRYSPWTPFAAGPASDSAVELWAATVAAVADVAVMEGVVRAMVVARCRGTW